MRRDASTSAARWSLVTGVGRAGQIGNAVALAFGQAGAKIVACDLNAVGVAERVREFAAAGRGRPALRRRPDPARHRGARGGDRAPAFRPARCGGQRGGRAHHLRADRAAHGRGSRPGGGDQSQDHGAGLPGRDRRAGANPGVHRQLRVDRLLRAPESRWRSTRRPRRRWPGSPGAWRWSWRDRQIRVNAVAPGMVRTGDNVAAAGRGGRVRRDGGHHRGVHVARRPGAGAPTGQILPIAPARRGTG